MPNEQNVATSPESQQTPAAQSTQQQTNQQTATGPTPAGGGQQQQQQTQQEKSFSYKEDRSQWIPPHRLSEVSGRLTQREREFQELQARLADNERKLRLAMGVEQQDPNEVEDEKARQVLRRLFPILEKLNDETLEQVLGAGQAAQQLKATNDNYWNRHSDQMLGDLQQNFAQALGTEKLTDSQAKRIKLAYTQEAEACHANRVKAIEQYKRTGYTEYDFDNDFIARHEKGDKTLIQEFVKTFTEDFFEPARRKAVQTVGGRVPVPNGRGRSTVASTQTKPKLGTEKEFKSALNEALDRYSN